MLIPLAAVGLALIHQGLGRSRSAAHAMLATLCALSVAAIVFVAVGFSLAGYESGASHVVSVGGVRFDLFGTEALFARSVRFDDAANLRPALVLCFEMFAAVVEQGTPFDNGVALTAR